MLRTFRYGKKLPVIDDRTLKMEKYLQPSLPMLPESYSVLDRILPSFPGQTVETLFPMDGNDTKGCCTIATVAHAETGFSGLIGRIYVMPSRDVVKAYLKLGDGQDNGLVWLDVMKYWRNHGFNGHKIFAFTSLELRNHDSLKRAIMLFGGAPIGFRVQKDAIKDFRNHTPWTPGRTEGGGHEVFATGWTPDWIELLTWGSRQRATWPWYDEMPDEASAVLPGEAQNGGFTPGVDYATLQQDLTAINT